MVGLEPIRLPAPLEEPQRVVGMLSWGRRAQGYKERRNDDSGASQGRFALPQSIQRSG